MAEIHDPKRKPKPGDGVVFNGYSIRIDGVRYPYKEQPLEKSPAEGIKVRPCTLEGNESTDVAFIEFEPGARGPIERFTGDREIIDYYATGDGYFLAVDPEGKIYYTELGKTEGDGGTYIRYGKDWTIMWAVAKDGQGLYIIELCTPPWDSKDCKYLDPTDLSLPAGFKEFYDRIVSLNNTS
ncbi:hypothetical protein HY045_02840 [Candidatus Woesebacteria bacterium]|nr:hypothetical protein [Candidatus Woesebacteria bacterium]